MMRKFLALVLLLTASEACAKVYVTEPLLVPQSPYAGMTFYVYKPYNMPKGWYVTLDGYPVRKNKDGTWVYGTSEGPNLVATNYVVGSVVPSMAGLTKWINDAQISELRTTKGLEVQQRAFTRAEMSQGKNYSTYMPAWTFNPAFMAAGNWRGTIDRMGVLTEPSVPVAWNGTRPKVIYLWTGGLWHQVSVKEGQTPIKALQRNERYIKRLVNQSGFKLYEQDLPILAQQAKSWGYYWFGELNIKQ